MISIINMNLFYRFLERSIASINFVLNTLLNR